MKIIELFINNQRKPIGINFDSIKVSFKLIDVKEEVKASIFLYEFKENKLISKKDNIDDFTAIYFEEDLKPRTIYKVEVVVKSRIEEVKAETSFVTGKLKEEYYAKWIGINEDILPNFIKNFKINKEVESAYLHITSLGNFEAFLNNRRIGEEYLLPYLSEYRTEVQLITFDVKEYFEKDNVLEIGVSNGWYKGHFGGPDSKEVFGKRIALYLELHIEYSDGSNEVIISDDNFKYRKNKVTFSDIYDGEEYYQEIDNNSIFDVKILDDVKIKIIDKISLPVIIKERIKVKEVIRTKKDEIVLDFGQNHTGFVMFHNHNFKGEMVLDHGEILQDDCFYNENYRSAKARAIFHLNGIDEIIYAHFTYYGYRFVRVSGFDDINPDDFTSCVIYSDIDRSGYFETGRKDINRLYLNSLWGLKSNFVDMPTDCPQRDERLGWSGDAQVFSKTGCLHANSISFYDKFLHDLRTYQVKLDGGVPSCIPEIFGNHVFTAVWSDAGTIIPMNVYMAYGDKKLLNKYYDLMRDWCYYLIKLIKNNNKDNMLWNFGFQYGDWLALDGKDLKSSFGGTPTSFIASVYFYNSLMLTYRAATICERDEKDELLEVANKVKKDILDYYFDYDGKLNIDTQTAYIISLKYNIYKDKQIIIDSLRSRLEKDNYYIKCGFTGAPLIMEVLADNKMADLSYRLLFNTEFPSWLYAVNLGATTIWERWNSVLPDGSISDTGMNSLNHYCYGSVASFMYQYILGLRMTKPGYEECIIEPIFNKELGYAKGSYNSVRGNIEIEWKYIDDDIIHFSCSIPYKVKAKIILEGRKDIIISNQKYDITYKIIK